MVDRSDVINQDRLRKNKRIKLKGDIEQVREDIRPKNIVARWKRKQIHKAGITASQTVGFAKKNRLILGGLAVGAAMIAGRRPLVSAAKKLKDKFRSK